MASRRKFLCLDCRVDTGKAGEHYFVCNEVWYKAHSKERGMLCVGCLEGRLGRRLKPKDFPDVTVNNPKFNRFSQRLIERMEK